MSTIKLHEATKQFKLSNKLAMFFLEKKNLAVKSHSSVITFDQLELLREFGAHPERFPDVMEALAGPAKKAKAAAGLKKEEKNKEADKKPAEEKKPAPVKAPVKEKAVPEKKPTKEAIKEKVEKPVAKKEVKEARPVSEGRKERTPAPVEAKVPAAKAKEKIPEKREIPRVAPSPPPPPPPKRVVAPVSEPVKKAEVVALPERIQVPDLVTVKELADKLNCKLKFLEEKMTQLKMSYSSNELMETENLKKLCQELQVQLDILPFEDYVFASQVAQANAQPQPRPPVVTVMGHVDHGKTTLLDTLRKTRVAENEAGGITQKIGATKLKTKDGMIVFIDTPGHEAFTNLRARGAKVTDIVILVVAANDGVQPQTVEAILHAQAAQVPIIVAINKIDLAGADPNKVKQELAKHNLLVEEWGGKVVAVEISAKLNQNLDTLLEMIHLVAQMQELKAYTGIPARGTVIEARLDPFLGPIATILIQHGRMKKGDSFICGNSLGKIKSIFDDSGKALATAEVPDPVELMGFDAMPEAGDIFQVLESSEKAQKVIERRQLAQRSARSRDIQAEKKLSFENLFQMMDQGKNKVFPVIIKADNTGSAEVLEQVLQKQSQEKLKVEIVYKGIGNLSESDVLLASAAKAVILGFNIKAPQKILALAKHEGIEIKLYNVIYHLIEDMEKAVKGQIAPEYQLKLIGKVEILQKFKISKVGLVAGCLVREGKVTNKSQVKVLRGDDLVFEGEIESLKRIKDEVKEVNAGTECGIKIKNFNASEIGDLIEIYEKTLV